LGTRDAVPVKDCFPLILKEMYCRAQVGPNPWEICWKKALNPYGLIKGPKGYGRRKRHLRNARAVDILRCVREPVPYILIYMDVRSSTVFGNPSVYVKKGVQYE